MADQDGELSRIVGRLIRAGGRHLLNEGIDRLTYLFNNESSNSDMPSIKSSGSKRKLDPEDDFDMHYSTMTGSAATSTVSQGGNLTLENVAGTPLMDNLENLHKHESHWEKEIYIETIYKCHGDNTSPYPYYIPWESLNACHSVEVLMDKFYNVSAWKPVKAECWMENGRTWITEQPTNANLNRKDVADFPIQIFSAGPEAPLNMAIFQSDADRIKWESYQLPSNVNTFTGIARRLYTGFSGFATTDISDNDPSWHQKTLGKTPATMYMCWKHEHHIDSAWRLTPEVFLLWETHAGWKATDAPFKTMLNYRDYNGEHYITIQGYPRFDYASGKLIKPKMDGRSLAEAKELSNQFTSIPSAHKVVYEQDILPCNSFKSLYYNMIRFGVGTSSNEDTQRHATTVKTNVDASFQNQTGTKGDGNYQNNYLNMPQQYFENNLMRPILFKGSKVNFTGGNMPVEFDYDIRIRHTIKVRYGDRDGMPENQYKAFQNKAITAGVPNFNGENFLRDKSKNINYYLAVVHNNIARSAQQDVQNYWHKTFYVPDIFPLVELNNV